MFRIEKEAYVEKVLNNSAMIINEQQNTYIVLGNGIAFQKKQGQVLSGELKVDKVFQLFEYETSFKKIIAIHPSNTNFIIDAIRILLDTIETTVDEQAFIAFCDHVAIMYERVLQKESIANPFIIETKALYKESYQLAKQLCDELHKQNEISIPENEVGYIALHMQNIIHQDAVSVGCLNKIVVEIKDIADDIYHIQLDEQEDNYARFISHLKFLIQRLTKHISIENALKDVIKERYASYYPFALDIANVLHKELGFHVSEDEIAFLVLHLARFIEI